MWIMQVCVVPILLNGFNTFRIAVPSCYCTSSGYSKIESYTILDTLCHNFWHVSVINILVRIETIAAGRKHSYNVNVSSFDESNMTMKKNLIQYIYR